MLSHLDSLSRVRSGRFAEGYYQRSRGESLRNRQLSTTRAASRSPEALSETLTFMEGLSGWTARHRWSVLDVPVRAVKKSLLM